MSEHTINWFFRYDKERMCINIEPKELELIKRGTLKLGFDYVELANKAIEIRSPKMLGIQYMLSSRNGKNFKLIIAVGYKIIYPVIESKDEAFKFINAMISHSAMAEIVSRTEQPINTY